MYKKFRVCFLGSSKCGKSAIISRYLWDHWIDEYNPTIEEHWGRNENIDGEDCTVLLHHDINLIDDYQSLIVPLMEDTIKRTDGVVIAYKISRRSSFDEIEQMRASVLRLVEKEQWPMILIETHCDLEDQRVVSREEGEAVARRWGVPFISTSARTNINVREAIIAIMREIKTYKHIESMKQQGIYKKLIPKLEIPPLRPSSMVNDIMTYLFDNKVYSDLTLVADNKPIYVHKSILFSRFPSFMERIKLEDKDIALESSIKYSAMLSVLKYVYTGKFERDPKVTNEEYLAVSKRWEVFTLLPMMKNEPVEEFETKFDRLFNLNFMSDLKVVVISKKKRDEIHCHKMILCARSEYFRAMYQGGFKETDNATLIIDDCSYEAVMWLVKYLYLDQLEVNNFDLLPEILMLSHRYYIEPCLRFIEHYLSSHLTIENVCSALVLSKQYALKDLKRACKEYVSYRYKPVSKTSAFKKLDKAVQNKLKSAQKEGPWDIEG